MRIAREQSAFTLVELIVTIFLVALSTIVLLQLFGGNQQLFSLQQAEVDVVGGTRTAVDETVRYVKEAESIVPSIVWNGSTWTSGANTLVLSLASRDASGDIVPGAFDTVLFGLRTSDPAHFFKAVIPHASSSRPVEDRTLLRYTSALTFTYDASPPSSAAHVTLAITASEALQGRTQSFTINGSARLRNAQ